MSAGSIVFGGSFDPPQLGHAEAIRIARAARPGLELVVLPAGRPPHKAGAEQSPAELRLEMARLAFEGIEGVRVSDEELRRAGTSYTVETLEAWRARLPEAARLCLLLGADMCLDLPNWREPARILELCEPLCVPRPGFDLDTLDSLDGLTDAERAKLRAGILDEGGPAISSTELRARLENGQDCSAWIAAPVLALISRRGLYGGQSAR